MNTAELVPLLFCCFAFLAFLATVLLVIFGSRLKAGALNVSMKAGGVEVNAAGGAFGVLAVVFGVLTWLTLPGATAFPDTMADAKAESERLASSSDPEKSKRAREIAAEMKRHDRVAASRKDPVKRLGAVFEMQRLKAELSELQGKSDQAKTLRGRAKANADWLARAKPEEAKALVERILGRGGEKARPKLEEITAARTAREPPTEAPKPGRRPGSGRKSR